VISEYRVSGYKSLRDISLQPARLNVLVGGNACGKSSLLQVLLLLRQSALQGPVVSTLQLSGGLFEAGTARDVLRSESRSGIHVAIGADGFRSEALFALPSRHERGVRELTAGGDTFQLPAALADESGESFAYLNAERVGPRVTYQLPRPRDMLSGPVGAHGELTTAFLARCQQTNRLAHSDWYALLQQLAMVMPEDLILDDGSRKNLARVDLATKQVLSWIIPGIDFEATEQSVTDSAQLTFVRDPTKTRTTVRPTHMGFGVTYTLPVIAAVIAMKPSSLVLVENPEAHLHPSSQSRIGTFLGLAASAGTQIFAETHSDHVVNGIRLAVKYGLIAAADVKFFFFRRLAEDDSSLVTEITMSDQGHLNSWPEGFFDQIERDLAQM
jgi:predicted ATPase